MTWTTPEDLRVQVVKLWENGTLPTALVAGTNPFPVRLKLKGPGSQDLTQRFEEVRSWAAALRKTEHVRVEMREVRHRVIGTNAVPGEAWVDTMQDALGMLGKEKDARQLRRMAKQTQEHQPVLVAWQARHALQSLQIAEEWGHLLDVVTWMQTHSKPSIYVRQLDLPGIDSKLVERHLSVLSELLDVALPEEVVDRTAVGVSGFFRRFGFREKPKRVRFRMLDATNALFPVGGDQDLTVDAETFGRLRPRVHRVFVTENETNFLAFPSVALGMVIFGGGYGFEALKRAEWLRECSVLYWGDIDTHGFAILDQLRALLPNARSFLMDRDTLLSHREHWGVELRPETRDLHRLTVDERDVYDQLRDNRLGERVRLEQERIAYGWIKHVLEDQCSS